MRPNKWTFSVAWWLGLVVFAPGLGLAQEAASETKAATSLLHWSTPNMQALSAAWLKTTPGKTTQSPALTAYREALAREDIATLFHLRPWIGIDWTDLATVDQRVTFVLLPGEPQGTEIAIWIQGDSNSAGVQNCRKAATSYWEKAKYRASISKSGELEIHKFTRAVKSGKPDERYLVLATNGLLLTTRATDHQSLLTQITGIATDEPGSDAGQGAASFSLKPMSLAKQRKVTSTDSRNWALSAERLGAKQIDHVQGQLRITPEQECCINLELRCPIVSPLKQALRLFEMPRGAQLSPLALASIKDDTIATWRWNSGPAMEAFGNLFDEMVEPGEFGEGLFADLLDGLKEEPESPQVDLRRDLFEQLGPRFRSFAQVSNAKTYERQWLYSAECEGAKSEQVKKTLEKFFKGDSAVSKQEIAGHTCWSVGPGKSLFIEVESENIVSFRAVAIGPEGFLIATDPAILQATLTKETPLSDTDAAQWKQLLAASEKASDHEVSARILLNTSRRFSPAFLYACSHPPPYRSWEPSLLHWMFYGNEANKRTLSVKEIPTSADIEGLFAPAWLDFVHQSDHLQVQAGFLDRPLQASSK